MNWSDAMKENANRVSGDRDFTSASDAAGAASTAWDPHDVWLTRIKQPRDRAAGRVMTGAVQAQLASPISVR